MELSSLQDLWIEELRDLYSAENQLIKALPKMAKAATNSELRRGFEKHLAETKVHAERLEQIFDKLGKSPKGKTCKAMKGLVEEGKEVMEEDMEDEVMDAALIAAAQRVEHYEIAGYGTARTWARMIGLDAHADVLQTTLDEEEETDRLLTDVAEAMVNARALEGGDREVQRSASRESGSSNTGGSRRSSQGDEARA